MSHVYGACVCQRASADLDEKTLGQPQLATVHLADATTFSYNQQRCLYLEFLEVKYRGCLLVLDSAFRNTCEPPALSNQAIEEHSGVHNAKGSGASCQGHNAHQAMLVAKKLL